MDSELNELQAVSRHERTKFTDVIFKQGAIIAGLSITKTGNVLDVAPGVVYIQGSIEAVPGATLVFDPAKTSGYDYVWVELLTYNYGYNQDAVLINPATGEPTAEREKWVLALRDHDTANQTLPNNVVARVTVPIYKFDRDTDLVEATVIEKSNLYISDLLGTLPGNRITVSSIREDQLSFAAAEGLGSLLQNLAERTHDQAGSYLTAGLDSFLGESETDGRHVITNAGRAYIQGYRLQRDLPTSTWIPKSTATKLVRGEQKTFVPSQRRYALNSRPLKETSQCEAIVEIVANVTRGSVGGGEDLLSPNPVVNILEVSQGATVFEPGVDWQQSGNMVDWLGTGNEPGIGTTYTVRWTYAKQMTKGIDYVDGGWFGEENHPAPATYYYFVTAFDSDGETAFITGRVVSRDTAAGELNVISWLPVAGALGYRIYRAVQNTENVDFQRIAEVGQGTISYIDDGVDVAQPLNPPIEGGGNVDLPRVAGLAVGLGNLSVINFGRDTVGDPPVPGSNCSIDYEYYLARRDIIYATAHDIKRLEGPPSDNPKDPVVPEGSLGLCVIDCPPNSTEMSVQNFGLSRVNMEQLHKLMADVEALKYNDARAQMNNELQNRTAQSKKGVYSDDFSNEAQSDVFHDDWSARINGTLQFVSPDRSVDPYLLEVDEGASTVMLKGSLALLPGQERVLVSQLDWSEDKNINPYAVFEAPEPSIGITPNIGRRGQTGIAVTGAGFTPRSTDITVRCDGTVVATGIVADEAGRANASFVIPSNATEGSRVVEMSEGSNRAETQLRINQPEVITRIQRVTVERVVVRNRTVVQTRIVRVPVVQVLWRTQTRSVRRDPLAQTFSFPVNRVVSAVGLHFTYKDATIPVTIQIRGVTTGLPNDVVLAEKVLAPSEVNLGRETKVVFDDPVYANANTSYAVVLLTNSTNYRVRIATLGQAGQNGVITSQAYNTGVLLESSNAETWTPLNASDLTCRIYGYDFQSSGVLQFRPITGVQFSEMNVDEYSAIPEGTAINWEASTDGGLTWDALVPAEEEKLPNIADQVLVRARFTGSQSNDTPALNHKDVALVGFLNDIEGTYLSRENAMAQTVASTKLYVQMDVPSATTVRWFASNDGGETWEPCVLEDTREIDHEWTEYTFGCAFLDPTGKRVRYKAEMTGTPLVIPRIHSLGATLS